MRILSLSSIVGLALPIYNTITIQETVMPGSGIEINVINKISNELIYIFILHIFFFLNQEIIFNDTTVSSVTQKDINVAKYFNVPIYLINFMI